MGMVVQHNMNAINSYNKLNANVAGMKKSSEKLSSGYRINRAGDDAAGLAVSEKMRSQIKGLNQAIRNSQDGINMIQTFEGAAQETHSILQRMKELATQSANGTYDNATDRAAIQLEFNQLNDELNQIADTDYNGTIVLNGGEMSDGLKQVGNTFDYANKEQQVVDAARAAADSKITAAQEKYDAIKAAALERQTAAKAALDSQNYDLSETGASEWNTVDNNLYDKDLADKLWTDLGMTDAAGEADTSITSLDVTFEYDGANWIAKKGTNSKGADVDVSSLTAKITAATTGGGATGDGGFSIALDTGKSVNAIFDATKVKAGDTVTLKFTNGPESIYAPNNIGFESDSVQIGGAATGISKNDFSVKLNGTDVIDDNMTQALKDDLDALNGMSFELTYGNTTANPTVKINGTSATLTNTPAALGNGLYGAFDATTEAEELKIYAADQTTLLATIDITKAAAGVNGTVEGQIKLSAYDYTTSSGISVSRGDDPKLENSNATGASQALADATAALNDDYASGSTTELALAKKAWDDAIAAKNAIVDYASAREAVTGVSVSDAFDKSEAIMTYAENITLQVGARTKDAVNFTFKYNNDKTADMGDLTANLNLSARKEGLNTENLSLATAEDANYAIDQIDKAINKTSMVRASFGAIQNRLEHKITNLTTTSENLTEAESSIRDTDMASEMMNYTKFNILQQAAQSMLAQANQQPQSILQLLG